MLSAHIRRRRLCGGRRRATARGRRNSTNIRRNRHRASRRHRRDGAGISSARAVTVLPLPVAAADALRGARSAAAGARVDALAELEALDPVPAEGLAGGTPKMSELPAIPK